jgi:universal stress protein A
MFGRILVAVADDEIAGEVLRTAASLAESLGARVALVFVVDVAAATALAAQSIAPAAAVEVGVLTAAELIEEEKRLGRAFLDDAVARFPRDRVETMLHEGVPADDIVATAKEWDADLLVVGTHRRGGLGRLVLGSVAEGILRHSPCPVLVVPKGVEVA